IIERIINGESCAQCSDAGTPAISDPGEMLVRQAIDAGIDVEPIPGACAAITALCASGLATGRFCFEGFISVSKKSRREHLNEIKDEKRTMIFYEAPHKLRNTLRDLLETLGDREITLARELTKLHEDICKTTLSAANDEYILREPRGEYVIVVEGRSIQERAEEVTLNAAVEMVKGLISGGMSTNEASKQVSALTGFRKSELYSASLDI
ncbi:MAG: 16S rRNA (cytidine(1402)-2'-O)-methyltransferase, partial [Oscillospiraceae bacterium]